jgi:hypothetical protein
LEGQRHRQEAVWGQSQTVKCIARADVEDVPLIADSASSNWLQCRGRQAYAVLRELERRNYLLTMTRGEEEEITDIVITPETFRCNHCRLVVSSRLDWEDHLPVCRHQQEKLRRFGLIALRGQITHATSSESNRRNRHRSLRSAPGAAGDWSLIGLYSRKVL